MLLAGGHFAIHEHRATLIAGNLDLQLAGQSPLLSPARPGVKGGGKVGRLGAVRQLHPLEDEPHWCGATDTIAAPFALAARACPPHRVHAPYDGRDPGVGLALAAPEFH